jgi:hypothetical protein
MILYEFCTSTKDTILNIFFNNQMIHDWKKKKLPHDCLESEDASRNCVDHIDFEERKSNRRNIWTAEARKHEEISN